VITASIVRGQHRPGRKEEQNERIWGEDEEGKDKNLII
jgi:hypothetical protein